MAIRRRGSSTKAAAVAPADQSSASGQQDSFGVNPRPEGGEDYTLVPGAGRDGGQPEEKVESGDTSTPTPVPGASPVGGAKRLSGMPASGLRGVGRPLSMRAQEAKMVYFDSAGVLPGHDKPVVPGGEKAAAEEAMRYRQRWLFTPATVLSAVDSEQGVTLIRTKDMQVHRVRTEKLRDVNPEALEGVPDAMSLSDLSEASLLQTLRERYNRDEVYTRVGPVLMSINPYKWIKGLYTEAAMISYHGKASMVEAGELAPHLFGVADKAYSQLVTGHPETISEAADEVMMKMMPQDSMLKPFNQSIIISGESGSGKTEATKIIMQYLARITSSGSDGKKVASKGSEKSSLGGKAMGGGGTLNVGELEERVLSCNPLLESFGNAQTLKNDNSSRFGKFIKIQFDKKGRIIGAQIQNYLLEKTRIVNQAKRERSYHVFYQLLAGASPHLRDVLHLNEGVAGFECLKGSKAGPQDAEGFEVTKACLVKIGINELGQDGIFRLLAAVLHLLNIGFLSANEGEGCAVKDETRASLQLAAKLLGVESTNLETALVSKTMAVHRASTMMLQTKEEAHDKAAALGKALYSQLFLWLVAKLNTTIAAHERDSWGFIGVLDIYGFEHFSTNSLEQLLINYANEQLQRHFNQHMFEVEQLEYEKEQIDWSYIKFNDNRACLELIDGRPGGKAGILATLDDIQRFKGGEANAQFLSQLKNNFAPSSAGSSAPVMRKKVGVATARPGGAGHPHFVVPRFDENGSFGIRHYAGEVTYSIRNFNEKNRENLSADIKSLLATSTNPLVVEVFAVGAQDLADGDDDELKAPGTPGMSRGRPGGRIREASVGAQFKLSLAGLIATISSTHPRYIRCVKPNPDKERDRLDAMEVLRQLQYSGMMETIRIRRQGYALRELYDDFFKKYSVLEPKAMNVEDLVAMLSKRLKASQEEWQIGSSKVFLRNSMADKLNLMVDLRMKSAARVIQRWTRLVRQRRLIRDVLQPFMSNSVVRLKYLRAAKHFRGVYLRRRMGRKILGWYRTRLLRRRFLKMKGAVVVIQAYARRWHDTVQLKLRKELKSTPMDELCVALERHRAELDESVEKGDFKKARSLQSRIHHLTILVTERGAEAERRKNVSDRHSPRGGGSRGISRQEIEVRLLEAEWKMADAEAEQDYALCSKLQREMKELEELREHNPTLPELREKAEKTRQDVETHAAKADYAEAGRLQEVLGAMELKIKDMEEEAARSESQGGSAKGKFSDLSPKELEELTSKSEDELEAAKSKKDFVKCMEIQARITELKNAIEAMPTLEQVEQEVLAAEAEMATAKAHKDYRRAAELTIKLPAMQERHSAIAFATRKAMSRKQLAEEIQRLEGEMRLAKAEKRFNKCSLLQKNLEELHAITEELPTVQEIEEQISELRSQMDAAVSQQRYAQAEQYRVRLTELQEEKALAIEKEASKDPSVKARHRLSLDRFSVGSRNTGSDTQSPHPPDRSRDEDLVATPTQNLKVKSPGVSSPVVAAGVSPSSARVIAPPPTTMVTPPKQASVRGAAGPVKDDRSVSRLRPKPPVTMSEDASVQELCAAMAAVRNDAALLTGPAGEMTGIITAIDLTRRVVAAGLDPAATPVREVMTPDPTTVRSDDGAMEALSIMVERHFRHLPVKSPRGDVTGVLDIAKCLYDAVSRLERAAERGGGVGKNDPGALLQQSVLANLGKAKGRTGKAAMAAMLAKLFESEGEPATLRELLEQKGEPGLVRMEDTVRTAGKAIAKGRKAVLVVHDGALAGIFTEKDLLNRVLAKGLNPDHYAVSEMMTPNPDTVQSSMTILGALQEMHQNKYLHLPVVDETNGTLLGLVSVMEIMLAIAGDEESSGWKALFGSALDTIDDMSESASVASGGGMSVISARASVRAVAPGYVATPVATPSISGRESVRSVKPDARPVSLLKPKPPLCLSSESSLFQVAKSMSDVRTDAAILTSPDGLVEGIITDHDITRRGVSKRLDPMTTSIREVMTPSPTMVRIDDSAMECLGIMVERRFRHLPVLDRGGKISGLLSIAKCLDDAITRLEKKAAREEAKPKGGAENTDIAATLLQAAAASKGRGKNKAKDFKAVLSMLVANMDQDGETEPTVGGILLQETPSFVDARESVTATAVAIAKGRKAVLVLNNGTLAGIITPKDVLNRVVSKGLDPDTTPVADVMTPNPDTVPPDTTVLDALREMHENKYLHLPVVDRDGRVMGVVSVMEVVETTVGAKGGSRWEAFFGSAMDAVDDVSDSASLYSVDRSVRSFRPPAAPSRRQTVGVGRAGPPSVAGSMRGSVQAKKVPEHRPVSKLKPKPPLCLPVELTVLQVAKRMADVRTDAVILLGADGSMKGILTDNDVARKVVGGCLDAAETPVASIMTPNPLWVNENDSAMEALSTMLEKHFRHLPVVNGEGAVCGLLNIARCLYDAIHRLEKKAMRAEEEGKGSVEQSLAASLIELQGKRSGSMKNKAKAALAVAQLLKGLSDGEQEPTLGEILAKQAPVFVDEEQTVADAGRAIVETRKAVLVLREGRLAGIVTPKDLLNRVVAKDVDPETTALSDIMTPNPDTVPPGMTVLEALREMHENKYLHLPVVDDSTGTVLGVVNVMEIIQATAGDKGSERWEAFFGSAMEAADDVSDTASVMSINKSVRSFASMKLGAAAPRRQTMAVGRAGAPSVSGSVTSRKTFRKDDRPVSRLRLKKPLIMPCDGSVQDLAMEMALRRTDAALLTRRGRLVGIVTDHDLTRRLIALDKEPDRTSTREIMTADPAAVNMDESAMKALSIMLDNRTRHLPVLDGNGKVGGLLDITKCLYDAIDRLEKAAAKQDEDRQGDGDDDGDDDETSSTLVLGAVMAAKALKGKSPGKNNRALQELMKLAMMGADAGNREGARQTLGDVLASKPEAEFVRPRHTVREAARVMATQKKAVLVVEQGVLEGIFTPRDMLNRVIAKRLSPSTTAVSSVMTPNPEGGPPSLTVLEALQQMSENRYLHMPVVDDDTGEVMGVVDVMEIIEVTVGQEGSAGWEAFFGSAMDAADDMSDTLSQGSLRSARSALSRKPSAFAIGAKSPGHAPTASLGGFVSPPPSARGMAARVGNDGGAVESVRGGRGLTPMVARVAEEGQADDEPPQQPLLNDGASEMSRDMGGLELEEGWDEKFVYKVSDESGHTYKFKASAEKLEGVLVAVADKLKKPKDAILLKYADDDGDQIVLSGDDSLLEAVDMARASSAPALKLVASLKLQTLEEEHNEDASVGSAGKSASGLTLPNTTMIAVGAGVGAVAVICLIVYMRRRKS